MNIELQILKEHSVRSAELISDYIESNPDELLELLQLVLLGDKQMSQRSAWVLSKFSKDFYVEFIPHLDFILSEIKNAKHVAVTRNLAKVFITLTDENHIEFLTEKQIDEIVDMSFGWVIDTREKAAVVVYGMYTLQNLFKKRSWIAPELRLHIINNMEGSLPSFKSAGKRILKAIELFDKTN